MLMRAGIPQPTRTTFRTSHRRTYVLSFSHGEAMSTSTASCRAGHHTPLIWSTALTSSPLESLSGVAGALGAGAILPCSDLRVECPNVKQYTALLEGQGPLLCRDPRERVVPVAWCQDGYSSHNDLASLPWASSSVARPYQWKSSPGLLAGLKKRASRKHSWL